MRKTRVMALSMALVLTAAALAACGNSSSTAETTQGGCTDSGAGGKGDRSGYRSRDRSKSRRNEKIKGISDFCYVGRSCLGAG